MTSAETRRCGHSQCITPTATLRGHFMRTVLSKSTPKLVLTPPARLKLVCSCAGGADHVSSSTWYCIPTEPVGAMPKPCMLMTAGMATGPADK